MKKTLFFIGVLAAVLVITSCTKDLDVIPKDPNSIMSANINDDPAYAKQVLAKIYASFIISGQTPDKPDITASDINFFTTMRAFWNVQEITTDEAICGWGDIGIADLNTQTWSPSNPFLTALFQRLGLSITYANDFLNITEGNTDATMVRYRAEARYLRALAYFWYLDLFGNPPFTTEADGVGKFYPEQLDADFQTGRTKLFNYIASELREIEPLLGEPRFSYPEADKGSCWMLLARLYLNSEVYTGTARWDSVVRYTGKVISSGKYQLASNYRQNFSADNDGYNNPEMIFAWAQDGINIQGYVGTTFIIESSSDATYLRAEDFHGLTSNTNWNGNRARVNFLNVMIDTIATYGNGPVPYDSDPFFTACKDKRVYLRVKKSPYIPSASSSGDYGIGVYKFTAKNADTTTQVVNYNPAYASTDFPIFRYADAFLMRAEASFRLGDLSSAVSDINTIRERAYGDMSGNITESDLTAQFILDERGREFYYEGLRRTDLIRFGQFTSANYLWTWKGGSYSGSSTSSNLNVFPIPGDEISSNPNLKQNPGY